MRNTILYILIVLAFFGLTYFLNKGKKAEFKWKPTYSRHDKQPFGAYVFDETLRKTLKYPYTHSYKGIYQLLNEDSLQRQNLMILTNSFELSEEDQNDLLQYVAKGNKVMIAAADFSSQWMDSLRLSVNSSGFSTFVSSKLNIRNYLTTITFFQNKDQKSSYRFPTVMVENYFNPYREIAPEPVNDDSTQVEDSMDEADIRVSYQLPHEVIVLAEDEEDRPILLKYPIGKGYLILSSTPRMFTNYGVLDTVNNGFVWQTLGYLQDQPLLRTENYQAGTDQTRSPLRYIISNQSLRWGLYISLIAVLLFMVFTAKRKQRAIPVIKAPENKMLSFVRSIAALYLRKNDNLGILRKKYHYWADRLRQKYGIDVINLDHDREFCLIFAYKTGQDPESMVQFFSLLDNAIHDGDSVPDKLLTQLITRMNLIK